MPIYHANATAVRAFGQWFIVTAESAEERRKVEARANILWLTNREPTVNEWENLEAIDATSWLNGE